jgi:serine/threonine protein kinase
LFLLIFKLPSLLCRELVLTQGHDKSADYWALGILIYEIICGRTPFESSNQQRTFEKIVHSQKHLIFPPSFDPHAKSLIRKLLHPNAALRFGALQGGVNDIMNHAFFQMKNLDFEALLNEELPMEYQPMMHIGSDESNSAPVANIEPLDVDFEVNIEPNDPYDKYFNIQ